MRRNLLVALTLLLLAGSIGAQGAPAESREQKSVTIAVVRDGPSPGTDIVPLIRQELEILLSEGESVNFRESAEFDAAWDVSRAGHVLSNALADPAIDIVLVPGALVGGAALLGELTKPVVSSFPQRFDLYGVFDQENDHSLKPNLSFALIRHRTLSDLEAFLEMVHEPTIHVALEEAYIGNLQVIEKEIAAFERLLDIEIRFIPVTDSAEAALAGVGEEVKAVLLARTPRLDAAERKRLIAGFNQRGIATFSHVGHKDVRAGALAAHTPKFDMFLARRVALNLHEVMRGVSPNELPVQLPVEARLLINGRTARQVGYSPGRGTLVSAEFLHPQELLHPEQPLTLTGAFEIAEKNNQNLKIATQEIETASRSRLLSRSSLYPQLFATGAGQTVKLPGLQGIIPDTTGSGGLSLNQMVYDDRKVSDFKASGRLLDSTREAREQRRLDVLGETGKAYYRDVLERTLFRVQRDNLRLTRQNLRLAQVRVEAGFSGKDEVFRWESEVAKRTSEMILQEAELESARVALNQILGIDQETRWAPEQREIDPEVFPLADGGLNSYLDSMASMARLRDALVAIALEDAPEMRVLREQMAALDIQHRQRKRLWYVPVFILAADWEYQFYRSPQLQDVDKDRYTVGVYGAYPIFQGGARKQEIQRVESNVVRLQEEFELARQIVERRTRTALQRVGSSFPVIRLSKMASESALKNFVVVQDKYTQGLVNVTDLLSAQNETFVTDQASSASNYIFLQDLIELQRSISWFEDEKTSQEKAEFVLRIDQASERTSGGTPAPGRE